jgi:hypothetical protein
VPRFVIACAVLLAACGSGSVATNSPTGTPQATVAPQVTLAPGADTAAPLPADTTVAPTAAPVVATPVPPAASTWVFSGSTDRNTKPLSVSGTLRIVYSVSSDSNFIVDFNGTDGALVASVANLIGSAKVTTWVYGASGHVYLEVIAGGPWKITVTQIEPTTIAIPASVHGSTDVHTVPITFAGGETVTLSHKGSGNFIVDLIDPSDGSMVDNIANTIGSGNETTQVYHSGDYALDVTADGPWTISIAP